MHACIYAVYNAVLSFFIERETETQNLEISELLTFLVIHVGFKNVVYVFVCTRSY